MLRTGRFSRTRADATVGMLRSCTTLCSVYDTYFLHKWYKVCELEVALTLEESLNDLLICDLFIGWVEAACWRALWRALTLGRDFDAEVFFESQCVGFYLFIGFPLSAGDERLGRVVSAPEAFACGCQIGLADLVLSLGAGLLALV